MTAWLELAEYTVIQTFSKQHYVNKHYVLQISESSENGEVVEPKPAETIIRGFRHFVSSVEGRGLLDGLYQEPAELLVRYSR